MGKNHSTPTMSLSSPKQRRSLQATPKSHDLKIHTDIGFIMVKNIDLSLTCGWLISEAIRKYDGRLTLVALKTVDDLDIIDQWLLRFEKTLKPLREIHELKAVFCEDLLDPETEYSHPIQNFKFIKTIGKGSHSKVILCRKVDTGLLYAVKIVEKLEVLENTRLDQILTERTILSQIEQSFIVKMHWAFQSTSQFFFVFNFYPGGELRFHLKNIGRLTENQARFYFAEILSALDYLHENNITYNNIKAENVLLDLDGHIKLVDFNLATANLLDDPFSLSPSQQISRSEEDEDRSKDFNDLGMLLYELLTASKPRFPDLVLPKYLSENCRSLLNILLMKNINSEVTSGVLKNHPWCEGVDWLKVSRKKVSPPFRPSCKRSNFSSVLSKIDVQIDNRNGDYVRGFNFTSPQLERCYFNIGKIVFDSKVTSERNSTEAEDVLNNLNTIKSFDALSRADKEMIRDTSMQRNSTTEEKAEIFESISLVECPSKAFSIKKFLKGITNVKFFK